MDRVDVFERMVVTRLSAGEYVKVSVRASGSATRAMRKLEGYHDEHMLALDTIHKTMNPASTTHQLSLVSDTPVIQAQVCSACLTRTVHTPIHLSHTASPYWLICTACTVAPF